MVEKLEGIRALYDKDNFTYIELTTNYRKIKARLPFIKEALKIVNMKGEEYKYNYTMSIFDWCKYNNIDTFIYSHL